MTDTSNPTHRRTNARILVGVGFAATFVAGLAVGGGAASADATSPAATKPSPAPTVTVTQTTERETTAQPYVPMACIDSLDTAESIVRSSGDVLEAAQKAVQAASSYDASMMREAVDDLNAVDPERFQTMVTDYNATSSTCRVAAATS